MTDLAKVSSNNTTEKPAPPDAVCWEGCLAIIEFEFDRLNEAATRLVKQADNLALEAADESADEIWERAEDLSMSASTAMSDIGRRLKALQLAVDEASTD
jgi:hypothetical protein